LDKKDTKRAKVVRVELAFGQERQQTSKSSPSRARLRTRKAPNEQK